MAASALRQRYRALPLIACPLEQEEHHGHGEEHGQPGFTQASDDLTVGKEQSEIKVHETYPKTPSFREKEEASSIELFYDLFFVANLSSFTGIHVIDDSRSMGR